MGQQQKQEEKIKNHIFIYLQHTPIEGKIERLLSLKRNLKKVSRLSPAPLRWKCLKLSMMACASSSVACSCFWTSIKNVLRFEGVMSSFSEYWSKRVLISCGASDKASLNLLRQHKQTLYVCLDMVIVVLYDWIWFCLWVLEKHIVLDLSLMLLLRLLLAVMIDNVKLENWFCICLDSFYRVWKVRWVLRYYFFAEFWYSYELRKVIETFFSKKISDWSWIWYTLFFLYKQRKIH